MKCQPEPENQFDCNAVKVMASFAEEIGQDILNEETRNNPPQCVIDIVGEAIGHVPRHICNIISISMRIQWTLQYAVWIYLGEMEHDHQGPKLKCIYLLEFKPNTDMNFIVNHPKDYIARDDLFL